MKLNNVRHVSQDFYSYAGTGVGTGKEINSFKTINLNNNKLYKIKNLNILIYKIKNTYSNLELSFFTNISTTLLLCNDNNFLNNLYTRYNNTFPGSTYNYFDGNGTSFSLPYNDVTSLDIEPTTSRNENSPIKNCIIKEKANLNPFYDLFYGYSIPVSSTYSPFGLLRLIPISYYVFPQNTFFSFSYIKDFGFYNNFSNKLNILAFFTFNGNLYNTVPELSVSGTIDFDLEEFEPEE